MLAIKKTSIGIELENMPTFRRDTLLLLESIKRTITVNRLTKKLKNPLIAGF
jgi:hypothetical protein